MKYIGIRTIKTAIGAVLAIMIASKLGLIYATSAGIITILSVQSTKTESFVIAFKRFMASILALFIGYVLFDLISHHVIMFGIFLLIFIPLTARFKIVEGIASSAVIVTHLLVAKHITIDLIYNELLLVTIGIVVALLINLYMPSVEPMLNEEIKVIEQYMREILLSMSVSLKEHVVPIEEQQIFLKLKNSINLALRLAYRNNSNILFGNETYPIKYLEMRKKQLETLKRLRLHFNRFYMTFEQTNSISEFTKLIALNIEEHNDTSVLIERLELLRYDLSKNELPKTRDEFENRAMLFQFLNDLEQFLEIKHEFLLEINKND